MSDLISRQDAIDALEEQLDCLQMLNKDENPKAESKWYGVNWARNTIADLPSAQQWIPCSERLPKEYEVVLITSFRKAKTFNQIPYLRMAYYCDGFWYPIPQDNIMFPQKIEDFDGGEPCVTAWMPLPEPWKG